MVFLSSLHFRQPLNQYSPPPSQGLVWGVRLRKKQDLGDDATLSYNSCLVCPLSSELPPAQAQVKLGQLWGFSSLGGMKLTQHCVPPLPSPLSRLCKKTNFRYYCLVSWQRALNVLSIMCSTVVPHYLPTYLPTYLPRPVLLSSFSFPSLSHKLQQLHHTHSRDGLRWQKRALLPPATIQSIKLAWFATPCSFYEVGPNTCLCLVGMACRPMPRQLKTVTGSGSGSGSAYSFAHLGPPH